MVGGEMIDIVLIWVDNNDGKWQKDKMKYQGKSNSVDTSDRRYRDWDNLRYIFRGIEKFMPWVRTIHFVTCGHAPAWLNFNNPKLNFVKHSDYIPSQYLPTFSSHPIELNLHRIKGLSDKFIYFNDDTFVVDYIKAEDFFGKTGLPYDTAINTRITSIDYNDPMGNIALNNTAIINSHFDKNISIKSNWKKWLNLEYGISNLIRSITFLPYPNFTGFLNPHLPAPFLKSSFEAVWRAEPGILDFVSSNKFRSKLDVNQYLIRDWQIVSGNFEPKNWYREGKYYGVSNASINQIKSDIQRKKYKLVCLNDEASDESFVGLKRQIFEILDFLLPDKSSFEM